MSPLEKELTYWRERLRGAPSVLDLPADRPRHPGDTPRTADHAWEPGADLRRGLASFCDREGVPPELVLATAFRLLLGRVSNQSDIVIGAAVDGDACVLRTDLGARPTVREALALVSEALRGAREHAALPLAKLVRELAPGTDESAHPLFQVGFASPAGTALEQLGPRPLDLTLAVTLADGAWTATFRYQEARFDPATIERMAGHFELLLRGMVAHPERQADRLALLTEPEVAELAAWNDTAVEYPEPGAGSTLHERIAARAAQCPDAVAVQFEDQTLTYRELNGRANQLARALEKRGVGPEVLVGICTERSLELVVGLLGILKAGGAYVPMDPDYPRERLAFMLEDARVTVLLTQAHLADALPASAAELLRLDEDWAEIAAESDAELERDAAEDNLAYVIFTSGSTGRPKGAMNTHRGICNRLLWMQERYALTEADVVLQKTPYSFDVSVWEIFWPLLIGARLVLARPGRHGDPAYLRGLIAERGITTLHFVPSMLQAFLEQGGGESCGSLERVICSGEALPRDLQDRFLAHLEAELHNLYGPTEAAIDVSHWACRDAPDRRTVPIGHPVANTQLHVLDGELQAVPVGVPGELYLGGVQVGRGYLDRPALTAEKFTCDPFSSVPGSRLYRTGDLVRRAADGAIDFLGRIDHQIKLRGFRIELGEIEAALRDHPAVEEAVVMAREDDGRDAQLVAYVVPTAEAHSAGSGPKDEQVARWRAVYDDTYARSSDDADPTLNFASWISSYTGEPFRDEELHELLDRTVDGILALQPKRVLELGCGAGLILFRVAPSCERYAGRELSAVAVETLRSQVERRGDELAHVSLAAHPADDFEGVEQGAFDTVVLNSVAQHFPGIEYLVQVMEGAVRAVGTRGAIFVGDVRSLPLLGLFHASTEFHRAADDLPLDRLREIVERRGVQEKELAIDPAFFLALRQHLPAITHVDVQLRRGHHHNEMTKFHYDVVLRVGGDGDAAAPPERIDWSEAALTLEGVRDRLARERPATLGLRNVPNARLAADVRLWEALASARGDDTGGTASTVGELRAEPLPPGVDPEQLWALGDELPYAVDVTWSDGPGSFDVLFRRSDGGAAPRIPSDCIARKPWRHYANDPTHAEVSGKLTPRLRTDLRERLPDFMVPSAFVLLDALPLSPNGKVDRRALPAPTQSRPELDGEYVEPRTELELELVGIWAQVLGVERIGVHDDFFDLGGHSLTATQVVARTRDALHAGPDLRAFLDSPSVAAVAGRIEASRREGGEDATETRPIPRAAAGPAPLAFNQEGLWFIDLLDPDKTSSNFPGTARVTGPLDVAALERSLGEIVRRHEPLRTTFAAADDGTPVQRVTPHEPLTLPVTDLTGLPPADREAEALRLATEEARRAFDVERGPLFRPSLLRLSEREHLLSLSLHHIVADGWSMGILTRELRALYEAHTAGTEASLQELPIRFADYCVWQREQLGSGAWDAHLEHWRERLGDTPPELDLPTDRPRPEGQTYRGAHLPVTLSQSSTEAVRRLALDTKVTLYAVLLAAFQVLLHRAAKQDDITLGTTFANRDRREFEGLIGFFANTLPLRTDLSGDPSFRAHLRRVREAILSGVVNQELPFAQVVKELQPNRDLGRHPFYRVVFDLLTPDRNPAVYGYGLSSPVQETVRIGDLSLGPVPLECGIARFDIAVFLWDMPDGLAGSFEFSTELFDAPTIQGMIDAYAELLRSVVSEPDARLSALVERLDRWEDRRRADTEQSYKRSLGAGLKGIGRRRS